MLSLYLEDKLSNFAATWKGYFGPDNLQSIHL